MLNCANVRRSYIPRRSPFIEMLQGWICLQTCLAPEPSLPTKHGAWLERTILCIQTDNPAYKDHCLQHCNYPNTLTEVFMPKGPAPKIILGPPFNAYQSALGTTLDSGNRWKAKHEIPAHRNLETKELFPEWRSPAPHSNALLSRT